MNKSALIRPKVRPHTKRSPNTNNKLGKVATTPLRRKKPTSSTLRSSVSHGEMSEILGVLLGQDASSFSLSSVLAFKRKWQHEYTYWSQRALDQERWGYFGAMGISVVFVVTK